MARIRCDVLSNSEFLFILLVAPEGVILFGVLIPPEPPVVIVFSVFAKG